MFASFKRTIRLGWEYFFNHIGISLATCFTLTVAILFISSIFIIKGAAQHLIVTLQEKADITAYFKQETPEEDIFKAKEELSKNPEIKQVKYVSREEALKEFTDRHRDDPEIMNALSLFENPFRAHLNINVFKAEQYPTVVNFLNNFSFSKDIEEIDYQERKPVIEQIFAFTRGIEKAGIIAALVLIAITISLTFNTIKLAIVNSREEIKIQKLVGASNWFIRGPFLFQGLIAGFFSFLLSFVITIGVLYFLSPKLEYFLSGFNLLNYALDNIRTLLLIQAGGAAALAVTSSFVAVNKYLKT